MIRLIGSGKYQWNELGEKLGISAGKCKDRYYELRLSMACRYAELKKKDEKKYEELKKSGKALLE